MILVFVFSIAQQALCALLGACTQVSCEHVAGVFLSSVVTEHGELPDEVLRRAWAESLLESDVRTMLVISKRSDLPPDVLQMMLSSAYKEVRNEALAKPGLSEEFVLERVRSSRSLAALCKVASRTQSAAVQRAVLGRCDNGWKTSLASWQLLRSLCANPSLRTDVAMDAYETLFDRSTWCGNIPHQTLSVVQYSLLLRRDLHARLARKCTNIDLTLILAETQCLDEYGVSNLVSVAVFAMLPQSAVSAEVLTALVENPYAVAIGAEHILAGINSLQVKRYLDQDTAQRLRWIVRSSAIEGVSYQLRTLLERLGPPDSCSRMACSTDTRWLDKQTVWAVRTGNLDFVTMMAWNASLSTKSCVAILECLGNVGKYNDRRRSSYVGVRLLAERVFREAPEELYRIVATNTSVLNVLGLRPHELRQICRGALAVPGVLENAASQIDPRVATLVEKADLGYGDAGISVECALTWEVVKLYCSDYTKSRLAVFIAESFDSRPEALRLLNAVCEPTWSVRDSVEVVLALLE